MYCHGFGDYYSDNSHKTLANPFINDIKHVEFVDKYFKRTGKHKVFEFIYFIPGKKFDNNRIVHTNSLIF